MKSLIDPLVFSFLALLVATLFVWRHFRKQVHKVSIGVFSLGLGLLYLFGISPLTNLLYYGLENEFAKPLGDVGNLDAIVVLAASFCRNPNTGRNELVEETASRVFHGVQMLRSSNANRLVFSGMGKDGSSFAAVMGQAAEAMGVPKSKILIESKSKNTFEHARELNRICKDKSVKIGLVSSAYHLKRSCREFEKYFDTIIPLPTTFHYSTDPKVSLLSFIPSSHNLHLSTTALREIAGNLWYSLRY